eukprot:15310776-Alexandrium_andersonii.AAC.1
MEEPREVEPPQGVRRAGLGVHGLDHSPGRCRGGGALAAARPLQQALGEGRGDGARAWRGQGRVGTRGRAPREPRAAEAAR